MSAIPASPTHTCQLRSRASRNALREEGTADITSSAATAAKPMM